MQNFENIQNIQNNRLAIFAYYDKDGIVDNYVVFLLKAMFEHCKEQIVIVNGHLTSESEAKIKPYASKILYRENNGYDITAYKEAFLSLEDINKYSEVVFYNQTIFGPVCSLKTMFNLMAQRNVDFWGISAHKGAKKASWDNKISIEPHIQSYFFVVKNKMFTSEKFTDYWQNLPEINSYWDAVSKHEICFTKHFEELGFKWDTYVNSDDLLQYNDYPMMGMPVEMLKRKSPFFKRKLFLLSRLIYTSVPQGYNAQELYDYILNNTNYPVSLICQNITRTAPPALINQSLTMVFDVQKEKGEVKRTAAVFWFADEPLADYLCEAASKMQKSIAILCIFSSDELKEKFMPKLPPKSQCITTKENGMVYLFKNLWQDICVFENILYCHNDLPLILKEFNDASTMKNTLNALSPECCGSVLAKREDIGAFVALPSLHQENLVMGQNWSKCVKDVKNLFEKANIRTVEDDGDIGFAVKGSMFFAKTSAIAPLCNFEFTPELFEGDYPAYEYLLPIVVHSTGKLIATACTSEQAFNEYSNNLALLQEIASKWCTERMVTCDKILFRMQGILDFYNERRFQMTLQQAFEAKLSFKQKMWICLQILFSEKAFKRIKKIFGKNNQVPIQNPVDELE